MAVIHSLVASVAVGGGGLELSHVAPTGASDMLLVGILLGLAPGLVFGMLLSRTPNHDGGKGNRGWWRFSKPGPKRPGPLPTGGEPTPVSRPVFGGPSSVPDHVPVEWTEEYLPSRSPRAGEDEAA
jgi:hypothetical protein